MPKLWKFPKIVFVKGIIRNWNFTFHWTICNCKALSPQNCYESTIQERLQKNIFDGFWNLVRIPCFNFLIKLNYTDHKWDYLHPNCNGNALNYKNAALSMNDIQMCLFVCVCFFIAVMLCMGVCVLPSHNVVCFL